MSLLKRLGFYLIGLAIGLVLLAFFLNRKRAEFCYLPNCRVLKELRSKPLSFSEEFSNDLQELAVDSVLVYTFLSQGDVDFGASDTGAEPCPVYRIEAESGENLMELTVENCDTLVTALALKILE